MALLYNLGILLYNLIIRISVPFNEKARLFIGGRKNWQANLREKVDQNARYLWMHCASLGEFEQGRPVIEEIRAKFPEYKILLTFFSPSGYEIRKNYAGADLICYLPVDTPKNAEKFLEITHPVKVMFVKYEFWFNYLKGLQGRNIPTYVFSANFRKEQHFFGKHPWGRWFRKMLAGFDRIFVQSTDSETLLKSFGIYNVTVSGDTRFDRVAKIAESSKNLPVVEKFKNSLPLVVAGSTWKPDEDLIVRYINQSSAIKCIIAPHEVSESNINRILQLLKKPAARFSQVHEMNINIPEVLVIDSIGLLSSLYKYGEIAYIGGGFGVGIHNILEAAAFGVPVVFGPNYEKFREARELVSLNAAYSIRDFNEFTAVLNTLLTDSTLQKSASVTARDYVINNRGATETILKEIF